MGVGIGPGHQWQAEQARDFEKLNEAQLCGWRVLLCSAVTVHDGRCLRHIEQALAGR